jgi:hypothetical protein
MSKLSTLVSVSDLESAVIEAAINLKLMNRAATPAHAIVHSQNDLMGAVDDLLEARKELPEPFDSLLAEREGHG